MANTVVGNKSMSEHAAGNAQLGRTNGMPRRRYRIIMLCLGLPLAVALTAEGQNCDLTTDVLVHWPIPALAKPAYLQTATDPEFGTTITRITGDPGDAVPVVGDVWKDVSRHSYSKDQAWNADQSLIVLKRHIGGPGPLFLDGDTYQVLFSRNATGANETRWHPTNPDLMIYVSDNAVGYWDVHTTEQTTIMTFPGYSNCMYGPYEGNPSHDGNWSAFVATRDSDGKAVAFAVDLDGTVKYPDIDVSAVTVDWVSISPLGTYVVVTGTIDGGDDRTQVYDLQGNTVGPLWSSYGRPSHYDMTVDAGGDEVAVGVSKSSPDNGRVIKRRLSDGLVTVLTSGGYAVHTSTRCLDRVGWAIVSYDDYNASWPPYHDEIVAVRLDGTRVERICHIRGVAQDYENYAMGVPSRDGLRVLYASDWASGDRPVQAYVADFRSSVLPDSDPDMTLTAPSPGSIHSGLLLDGGVAAAAHDADAGVQDGDGIDRVVFELLRDGVPLAAGTDYTSGYTWGFDTSMFADGAYAIRATATASAGAGGSTSSVQVDVVFANSASVDRDADVDRLPDWWELLNGLDPLSGDSDGDGTPDADEDTDGDGQSNGDEIGGAGPPDDDGGVLSCAGRNRTGNGSRQALALVFLTAIVLAAGQFGTSARRRRR